MCVCVTDSDTDLLTGSPGFIVCKACEWKDLHSTAYWNISSVVRQVELWQAVSLLSLVNVAC